MIRRLLRALGTLLRRCRKTLKLAFDRSFAGASWKQIAWLFTILALVMGAALWIESCCTQRLHDMRILELLLDPGSFVLQEGDPQGSSRLPLLLLTFIGAIFFTGGLISVVSNILTGRIARFRQGEIRYRFDGHIVLLGANDTVAGLIRELHAEQKNRRRDIVLLTQTDVTELRRKLHTRLTPAEERQLILLHGQRDSREELERIRIHRAEQVFLLSDEGEPEHDSASIHALLRISEILATKHPRTPLPCHISFEYQSSFQVFQLADFDARKEAGGAPPTAAEREENERRERLAGIQLRIALSATNFHENWAQRVLVSGRCRTNGTDILYPPLDRGGIRAESDCHVHLIVAGMSRMGVAMGVTAAHIAHYPNFVTQGIRTRITFIDPEAEREMNFLKGRYEPLFRLSHHTLRKPDASGGETCITHTPQEDFLDVEWEFVADSIESPYVRSLLEKWTADEKALTTLAICGNSAPQNIAAALYLPQPVYDRGTPIFVYQKDTATVVEIARTSHRYRAIYPFGTTSESYDATLKRRIEKAMRINYIYNHQDLFTETAPPFAGWRGEEMQTAWERLSLAFKWSNIYAANTIPTKLRSLGIDPAAPRPLDAAEVELFAQVEHNRWNVERLLTGYRPASAAERERAKADTNFNDELKKRRFIHINIAPYDAIPEATKDNDRILTRNLDRIER